jgi:hypothetical protein
MKKLILYFFCGAVCCIPSVLQAAPGSVTPSTKTVSVDPDGAVVFPAARQLVQVFTSATKATTAPLAAGQLAWETDTGLIYRATGAAAGNWSAATTAAIVDGTIVNADISASAAIAYAKLALGGSIVNADISSSAAIAFSKIDSPTTLSGYGITDAQPLDSDLTSIAAVTTTSYGRSVLALADASALRTLGGLVIGTNVQAYSAVLDTFVSNGSAFYLARGNHTGTQAWSTITSTPTTLSGYGISDAQPLDNDLTTYAGITPSANVQSLLGAADYAAVRTQLGLVIGTNVQAFDADLTTYAGITPSANVQSLLGAADYAAVRTALGLVIGTDVQAFDADLSTYAGITPSANVQSLLGAADYSAMRTQLGLVIGTNVQAYSSVLDTFVGNGSAFYLARGNHTGTQAWSTITSTPTTLSGYGITDAEPLRTTVTQVEAEAGSSSTVRAWTPQRVKQAIDALAPGGSGTTRWIYTAVDYTAAAGEQVAAV